MKKIIANWKMNLNSDATMKLAHECKSLDSLVKDKVELILAPSSIYLNEVRRTLIGTSIGLAGQDVSSESGGSYTGEISAKMLKEFGVQSVIIWHSERRYLLDETMKEASKKISQCFANGLTPVLCVGETLPEKMAGETERVVINQLHKILEKIPDLIDNKLIIAYEPVWAIGTKQNLDVKCLQDILRVIKRGLSTLKSEKYFSEKVDVLYGGSVDENNIEAVLAVPEISGVLVGTASLDFRKLNQIVESTIKTI